MELEDGTNIIFLNSKGYGDKIDPDIGAFLDYVNGQEPKGEFTEEIAQEVDNVKARRKVEEEFMTYLSGFDNARAEGIAIGEAKGEAKGRFANAVESVRNMMETLKFTAQAAMDALKIPPSDRPAILAVL